MVATQIIVWECSPRKLGKIPKLTSIFSKGVETTNQIRWVGSLQFISLRIQAIVNHCQERRVDSDMFKPLQVVTLSLTNGRALHISLASKSYINALQVQKVLSTCPHVVLALPGIFHLNVMNLHLPLSTATWLILAHDFLISYWFLHSPPPSREEHWYVLHNPIISI